MTNEIMKLADSYAHCYIFVGGEDVSISRAALEQAVQAQAAEIERLTLAYEELMHGPLGKKYYEKISYELQAERDEEAKARDLAEAKLDAATKVPLTNEQIDKLWANESINTVQKIVRRRIVRDAEAAHNIKGTLP